MNTAPVSTIPLQKPPTAKKKYTPATVLMKRFTCTFSFSFTSPVYSHSDSPVTSANRNSIANASRKHTTTAVTKNTPVMLRTIRLLNLLFFFSSVMMLIGFGHRWMMG